MYECGQAYPENIAPCERNNRVKAMEYRPLEKKDTSHNKTVFGFQPCINYWK